jgi:hypothetical protein
MLRASEISRPNPTTSQTVLGTACLPACLSASLPACLQTSAGLHARLDGSLSASMHAQCECWLRVCAQACLPVCKPTCLQACLQACASLKLHADASHAKASYDGRFAEESFPLTGGLRIDSEAKQSVSATTGGALLLREERYPSR